MKLIIKTKDASMGKLAEINKNGITGWEAASIMNCSPYRSRNELKRFKMNTNRCVAKSKPHWGKILSESVAHQFKEATGFNTRRKNGVYQSKENPFMLIHMDRFIVGQSAGLKCKTTRSGNSKFFKGELIPAQYFVAAQHYMAVTGYKKWYFAVLCGGNKLIIKCVLRSNEYIEKLICEEEKFWKEIKDEKKNAIKMGESNV